MRPFAVAGVLAATTALAFSQTQTLQSLLEQGYAIVSMQVINAGRPGSVALVLTKNLVVPNFPTTKSEISVVLCVAAANAEMTAKAGLEIGCRPLH
jgi:hypothetical protein